MVLILRHRCLTLLVSGRNSFDLRVACTYKSRSEPRPRDRWRQFGSRPKVRRQHASYVSLVHHVEVGVGYPNDTSVCVPCLCDRGSVYRRFVFSTASQANTEAQASFNRRALGEKKSLYRKSCIFVGVYSQSSAHSGEVGQENLHVMRIPGSDPKDREDFQND